VNHNPLVNRLPEPHSGSVDAPPAATSIRQPATPFIGRARELDTLSALLDDPLRRMVTVVGAPGVGKTRTALEAARRCAERFPGGVVAVSLAGIRDPGLLVPALLAAAGGVDTGKADPMGQLVRALSRGRTLLVVDNTEHLPHCGDVLAELVGRCAELTVLATGRQPLAVSGERVQVLEPLDTPDPERLDADRLDDLDAVMLLEERLRAVGAAITRSPETTRLLAGVCRLLDGLPLAIELAAARGRVEAIPGIHATLQRRLPRLDRGPRDAEPRHRTMRDAIAWSAGPLDGVAALAFRHAGVFAGGWTLDGLAAVVPGVPREAIATALDDLADRSLVVAEPAAEGTRYRMLEVIREFAVEQLGEAEDAAARRHHAAHMRARAGGAAVAIGGPEMRRALDELEMERDNLRAALRWAVDSGDTATAEELCLAQRMLWYVRGPLHEGCDAFAAALSLPVQDLARRSRVLSELAALQRQCGAFERAAELAAEACALARQAGEPLLVAGALLQQGFVAHLAGDFARARLLLDESLALAEGRDEVAAARALHHLGVVLHFGEHADAEAEGMQRRALDIYRRHRVRRQVATVQVGVAGLARCRGDLAGAGAAMDEALRIFAELRDLPVLSYALQEAAGIAAARGRYDRALRLLGAADHVEAITGAPTWPVLARASADWLPDAVAAVGAARSQRLRESGGSLEPAEAIALARGDEDEAAEEHRLSRREREVAGLVARGLTNREIAARLFLSERTVDGHVARILRKLDFRTRTQVATWVSLGGAADEPSR